MANRTFYGSAALSGVQPKAVHAGLNAVVSVYSCAETLSASMTFYMAKLPDGARIVDVIINQIDSAAGSNGQVSVGVPGAPTQFITSASANAATPVHINNITGMGYLVDVSDDTAASQPYAWLTVDCKTSTTGTASGIITVTALYYIERPY